MVVDPSRFQSSPVGSLVRITGHDAFLNRDYDHFAFAAKPLPSAPVLEPRTYVRLAEAERAIGRLDASAQRLPNPNLLVRAAVRKEAMSTSALEGTHAPLEDVLLGDYLEERAQSGEVREIRNYVRAATIGLERIKTLPICVRLINELQSVLVRDTRSDGPSAGRLRDHQVFIGEREHGIEASRFVPMRPGDALAQGVSDWEKWVNASGDIPLIARLALGHYQFETLHPYNDGNGRLGRLIMTLQMVEAGALRYPILNLSPWLEPRKERYKDLLLAVSETGHYDPWISFICDAVEAQATATVLRIDQLMDFRVRVLDDLRRDKARGVVLQVVEALIGYPMISASEIRELFDVTWPPAQKAIQRLESMGVLHEMTGGNYARVYFCAEVAAIVDRF